MAKTAVITLGGTEYTVRCFTLDELEEITDLVTAAGADAAKVRKLPFGVLRIALRRADPAPPAGGIEATVSEVRAANAAVLELAGMVATDADPPMGQETGAG
jgi:hypothetical protein